MSSVGRTRTGRTAGFRNLDLPEHTQSRDAHFLNALRLAREEQPSPSIALVLLRFEARCCRQETTRCRGPLKEAASESP